MSRFMIAVNVSASALGGDDGKFLRGDVDCSEDVDVLDALQILRNVGRLHVNAEEGCPPIGELTCPSPDTGVPAEEAAIRDLQERLDHCFVGAIEVREVQWNDSCLGVAVQPDEFCLLIITPGYYIQLIDFLTDEGYTYHTDCQGAEVIAIDFLPPEAAVSPAPPESPGSCG